MGRGFGPHVLCCMRGGGLGARLGLGNGSLQSWTSTSIVLGQESLDGWWSQDRAVAQHVLEVRGLPLLHCRQPHGLRNVS